MRGCELVFHTAGYVGSRPPELVWRMNALSPRLVVEAAAAEGVPRVVHTSSVAALGRASHGRAAAAAGAAARGRRARAPPGRVGAAGPDRARGVRADGAELARVVAQGEA